MAYPTVKRMLNRGPAADNRYQALFTGVSVGDGPGWAEDVSMVRTLNEYSQYFITNMTMPGSSFATGEMYGDRALGVQRKYAHTRMFNEFSMTFLLEAGMELYGVFDYWMNQISPRYDADGTSIDRKDIRMNYYNNYVDPKIILKKFERDGTCSLTTEVFNAFPLNISDLSLSSRNQNGVLELTVNFAYETAISYIGGYSSERASGSSGAGTTTGAAVSDAIDNQNSDVPAKDVIKAAASSMNPRDNKVQSIQERPDLITWANANERMIDKVGTPRQKEILQSARLENAAKALKQKPLG